jgi:thiamine biosynthesis protein ThiS
MEILVNGEPHTLGDPACVGDLLRELAIPSARVAVEVNEEIVARETFTTRSLANGDRVEIVHFVGGGT